MQSRVSHPCATMHASHEGNEGQLFESMGPVSLEKDLISLVDLDKHCLSILARVVVWMPCLGQLPVAPSYLFKRGLRFQG